MEYLININALKEGLEDRRVPKSYYRIGAYGEEALCILPEDGKWVVFEGEHGQRYNVHSFESESEACLFFWKRLQVFLK